MLYSNTNANYSTKKDIWIGKLDISGEMEWNKTIGGNREEYLTHVLCNDDVSFTILAGTRSLGGDISGNHGELNEWPHIYHCPLNTFSLAMP